MPPTDMYLASGLRCSDATKCHVSSVRAAKQQRQVLSIGLALNSGSSIVLHLLMCNTAMHTMPKCRFTF